MLGTFIFLNSNAILPSLIHVINRAGNCLLSKIKTLPPPHENEYNIKDKELALERQGVVTVPVQNS